LYSTVFGQFVSKHLGKPFPELRSILSILYGTLREMALFAVSDLGEPRGKALLATADLEPGMTVLTESCLLFAASISRIEPLRSITLVDWWIFSLYIAFLDAPAAVQERVNALYVSPGIAASWVTKFTDAFRAAKFAWPGFPGSLDEFTTVGILIKANCFEVMIDYDASVASTSIETPVSVGYALADSLSRANHSCSPNCICFSITCDGSVPKQVGVVT
jgi:hypothetical protein